MADVERTRRRELLHEIRRIGGRITARKDLQALARTGVLIEHGPDNGRAYHLNHAKGGRS